MMDLSANELKTLQIFFPHAFRRHTEALTKGTKFVHYTSAEVGFKIIKNKEVWMRKASCMADFMEISHGFDCLASAYKSEETGVRFKDLMNSLFDGFCDALEKHVDGWRSHFETDTYLTCFSEHDDTEDTIGRLSMWRAYGGTTGIAFVINNGVFLRPSDALKAYTSPVAYLSSSQFENELSGIVTNIETNKDFVQELGRDFVFSHIFEVFKSGALCTKHPGFREEREWRVIYSPSYEKSDKLIKDIQVVGGTPQPIYKIKLQNFPDEGFYGAEIPELVNRIIIGPTQYGSAIREAFVEALAEAGVEDAGKKVWVSEIPLR